MQAITLSKNDNREDFEGLYWVTKVPCDKSGGAHHETVQIKDGLVMRTDGFRMHIFAPEADFEDGLYSVARRTKKELVLIPYVVDNKTEWRADWEIIFPIHRNYETTMAGYHSNHESVEFVELCKFCDEVIDFHFFTDVLEDTDEPFEVFHYRDNDTCPIFFLNDRKLAAIMPIRTK